MEAQRVGRNDPCPCGNGKKYRQCCWLRRFKGDVAGPALLGDGATTQPNPRPRQAPLPRSKVRIGIDYSFSDGFGPDGRLLLRGEQSSCSQQPDRHGGRRSGHPSRWHRPHQRAAPKSIPSTCRKDAYGIRSIACGTVGTAVATSYGLGCWRKQMKTTPGNCFLWTDKRWMQAREWERVAAKAEFPHRYARFATRSSR